MSQRAVAHPPSSRETKWTVTNGSMSGAVRLMNAEHFTIGRSPECDFVLVNDPKCSRKHAEIRWTDQGCEITSLNTENLVQINGKGVAHAVLADGDMVTLGTTNVQFNTTSVPDEGSIRHRQLSVVKAMPEELQLQPEPAPQAFQAPMPRQNYAPPGMSPGPRRPQARRPAKNPPAKNSNKMIVYIVVAALFGYLFFSDSVKKRKAAQLRTEQQIESDIEVANKLQEEAVKAAEGRGEQSLSARQAQENFVRGFRDYRKGQFERALDSFQSCLALDPQHLLCNRYLRLSQRRFSELVQYEIVLGRKYRDQNRYQACRASFKNVMSMVKDASSPAYREAKANYDACNAMTEGRY